MYENRIKFEPYHSESGSVFHLLSISISSHLHKHHDDADFIEGKVPVLLDAPEDDE